MRFTKTVRTLVESSSPIIGDAQFYSSFTNIRTFQASLKGTGPVTAQVIIQGSLDGEQFVTLGTIDLSGSGQVTDGFVSYSSWAWLRARVVVISGTNATVKVSAGI